MIVLFCLSEREIVLSMTLSRHFISYHQGTGKQAFLIPLRVIGTANNGQLSILTWNNRFHTILVFDPGTQATFGVVSRLKRRF